MRKKLIIGGIFLLFFGTVQVVFCYDDSTDDVYYNPRFEQDSECKIKSGKKDRKKHVKEIVFVEDTTQTRTDTIKTIIK